MSTWPLPIYFHRINPHRLLYFFSRSGRGKADDERGSFLRGALGGQFTAVSLYDFPADGKAHAGAFVFAVAMQAFKGFEYALRMFFVEPDALIPHANFMGSVFQQAVADQDPMKFA